jgi:hypothetical protein
MLSQRDRQLGVPWEDVACAAAIDGAGDVSRRFGRRYL